MFERLLHLFLRVTSLLSFCFALWGWNIVPVHGASLTGISIRLPVNPLRQLKITSCGPAVLTMAYRYAYPLSGFDERDLLTFAETRGYYTETKYPYTSPANMVQIVRHYTRAFSTGQVSQSDEGLALLLGELQTGRPVIIDVTTQLDDPRSGAHFVLVTGLTIAPDNPYAVTIHYNDPLTGKQRSAPWYGQGGVWNAWRHTPDPGGQGWWLSLAEAPRRGRPAFNRHPQLL